MVLLTDIRSSVKLTLVLIVLACLVSAKKKLKVKHGPSGMSFEDTTNCTEFAKFGRFNPLSVLREKWFVFYYWAPVKPLTTYVFTYPSANHTRRLKKLLDGKCILPVMWEARQVLMEDNDGYISLLVERGDRGEYWLYPVAKVKPGHKITPRDVRLKQTGDNRVLGLMDCAEETLLVMARLNDVPRKKDLYEVASRLGYRGRRGRSYLYQGHEWGPVGEADEEIFWDRKVKKDTTKEDKSSEENSEEVESLPLKKPEEKKSKPKKSEDDSPPVTKDLEQCVKVVPELWNDPKPNPNPDNLLITKKDLETNNTLIDEAADSLPNNTQESNLDIDSVNTQKNAKLDIHQEVHETEVPLIEQKNLESRTEDPDSENENCVVCYYSQLNYMPAYIPDRTELLTNLNNNGVESTTEVARGEIPHNDVLHTEAPADISSGETTLSESKVLGGEFPRITVLETEVPFSKIAQAKVPDPEVTAEITGTEVPHIEVPVTDAPRPKILGEKVPSAEIMGNEVPYNKVPVTEVPRPKILHEKALGAEKTVAAISSGPPQDMTNSSEVIILAPKTFDDLKS